MEIPYAGLNHELILTGLAKSGSNVSAYTHKLSLPHSQSQCTPTYWRVCHNFVLAIFSLPVPFINRLSYCVIDFLTQCTFCLMLLYKFPLTLIWYSFVFSILYVSGVFFVSIDVFASTCTCNMNFVYHNLFLVPASQMLAFAPFLSFIYVIVNWIPFGFGSVKMWWLFFTIFHHFPELKTNWKNNEQIIDNATNC